jgi:sulfur-carrier protein adenylyltransferase/sulfurtransferase
MLSKEEFDRYSRHLKLQGFGLKAQEKLKESKVLVIGAGGLGSPVLLYLAAAGVGNIGIVDFDTVSESNLQRQVIFTSKMAGKPKAEMAAEQLKKLNPFISVNAFTEKLSATLALQLFKEYDLVVDGTDNFATRYLINDACTLLEKPLVYGAINQFQGQISVLNFEYNGIKGPTYRCLFPEPPGPGESPACSEVGVLGVLPGIIGCLQATESIKVLAGIGEPLSGKLLMADLLNNQFNTLEIERDENAIALGPATPEAFLKFDYSHFCGLAPIKNTISPADFKAALKEDAPKLQVIDVREPHELPKLKDVNTLNLPLPSLQHNISLIGLHKKTILICQSGIRSYKAFQILQDYFAPGMLFSLDGGVEGLGES